jgi:hypothetical protein
LVLDLAVPRHVAVPLARIVADEVVADSGQPVESDHRRRGVGADEVGKEYIGRRRGGGYLAGGAEGRLVQAEDRLGGGQEQGAALSGGKELDRGGGLALVGLEAQRLLAIALELVRRRAAE